MKNFGLIMWKLGFCLPLLSMASDGDEWVERSSEPGQQHALSRVGSSDMVF